MHPPPPTHALKHAYTYTHKHKYTRVCLCVCAWDSSLCVCVRVCVCVGVLTSAFISTTQSLQGVHMRPCMCSLSIRVGEEGGVSTSLNKALVAWRWGFFLRGGYCLVTSLFLTRVGVYVSVCVCIQTLRASVAQLVRARDCSSLGRRSDHVQNQEL